MRGSSSQRPGVWHGRGTFVPQPAQTQSGCCCTRRVSSSVTPACGVMPVPRHSGHAVESCLATALRMNSLLFGIASSNAASSGSTLNATICLFGRGLRGTGVVSLGDDECITRAGERVEPVCRRVPRRSRVLTGVPALANLPLVVQIGKWRRRITVPEVADCATTTLPDSYSGPTQLRLPRSQKEGDMPQMAILTGGADDLACFLTRVGVDPSEYAAPHAGGRVDVYRGLPPPRGFTGPGGGLSVYGPSRCMSHVGVVTMTALRSLGGDRAWRRGRPPSRHHWPFVLRAVSRSAPRCFSRDRSLPLRSRCWARAALSSLPLMEASGQSVCSTRARPAATTADTTSSQLL